MKHTPINIVLALLLILFAFSQRAVAGDSVSVTILYDNTTFNSTTTAHWGFSCLIGGLEKTILFDAGANGTILLGNAAILGVSTKNAPLVVVSHDHSDHTAGLRAAIGTNSTASVYIGSTFSVAWDQVISATGASVHRVSDPTKLLPTVQTTGEVLGTVNEQSLIISVDSGLVVIMGCSHPGVLEILSKVKQQLNKEIYMVIGGFHWYELYDNQIAVLIKGLQDLGVKKCGATHCTGDIGISLLRQAFGSDFVDMGVGRVIKLSTTLVTVKEEIGLQSKIPQTFSLSQNYPNPFNPSTVISYQLPVNSMVSLKIYDLLGREIATLVNEEQSAGWKEVEWNASAFSSGIYFYKLQTSNFIDVKKMSMIK
jgi:7,8-dihydropterin-6-yl-methyl-4-(beta-D-ribofuranosyl)aminobenzene 5'-phosphate synthase